MGGGDLGHLTLVIAGCFDGSPVTAFERTWSTVEDGLPGRLLILAIASAWPSRTSPGTRFKLFGFWNKTRRNATNRQKRRSVLLTENSTKPPVCSVSRSHSPAVEAALFLRLR